MRDIIKITIPLFLICIVTGFLLSFVNSMTKEPIQQRIDEDAKERKAAVLKTAQSFAAITDLSSFTTGGCAVVSASRGLADGKTAGYVFVLEPKGYGGAMNVTVGIDMAGTVTGVSLGDNKETPGLGTKAGEPSFINQFISKTIREKIELVKKPPVGNQIQAISGATISSRAVTNAVQTAAENAQKLIEKEGAVQ